MGVVTRLNVIRKLFCERAGAELSQVFQKVSRAPNLYRQEKSGKYYALVNEKRHAGLVVLARGRYQTINGTLRLFLLAGNWNGSCYWFLLIACLLCALLRLLLLLVFRI